MTAPQILRTKLTPPRPTIRTLRRPRVSQALDEAVFYRVTLLQAGAGYGKSTELGMLAEKYPLIWYQLADEDTDPLVFLLHLCHATRLVLPGIAGLPLGIFESWDGSRGPLPSLDVTRQYLNALSLSLKTPTLLILDDVHRIADSAEIIQILDGLIGGAPPDLHMIWASRPPLQLPNLNHWRARGQVLDLDQKILLFTSDEILDLFSQNYHYELTHEEADSLANATEGWAITLQLIWQSLRSGATASIQDALTRPADSLESLFDVLAKEVFGRQTEDVQQFLRISATLRGMTPEACDALRMTNDSAAMLSYLQRQELFIVDLGDGSVRYHHIFHRFLRQMSTEEEHRLWHGRAATYFQDHADYDEAIYHLLRARDYNGAAVLLVSFGEKLLAMGRLDSLATYLDELPPETLYQRPQLLSYLGDLARLHSRFQEALGWYQQAEGLWRERGQQDGVVRALRGQARVYLDTVNPSKAGELLQRALRLSDGTEDREAQARLYELLAENKLNAGKPQEAERLWHRARSLRQEGPADSELLFRVLMRTGRLEEARRKLESQAQIEREQPVQTPRAHRETQLLLSIIYAFEGEAEKAYRTAQEGTHRGVELNSPFVIAVGHMRQGHGLMLLPGEGRFDQAREQFEKTIGFSRSLAIPRLSVEANWGLCRVCGYRGDLVRAQDLAEKGIEIADQAGDEWIASLIRLTMGASFTLAKRYEAAAAWVGLALRGFQECSDPFGAAAAQLWQCLGWYQQGNRERLEGALSGLLTHCRDHAFDFLLTRPTLLGPPSERMLVPMLILARDQGWEKTYVRQLLQSIQLPDVTIHPGYQLKIHSLGGFQTWLGDQPVQSASWRREKTRQLFQLLLTYRSSPLDRDQIFEYLWPEKDPAAAQRNFKVAMSTLLNVLEPARQPGAPSAYILREGSVYGLRPGSDIWLDADEFLKNIQNGEDLLDDHPDEAMAFLELGLGYYQGEYLPDARYEPWAAEEREHIVVCFIRASDQLCALYLERAREEDAIRICQTILAQDNCWERAYRHLMKAYSRLGDHGQVARTFQRCVQALEKELEISPAPETMELFQQLTDRRLE